MTALTLLDALDRPRDRCGERRRPAAAAERRTVDARTPATPTSPAAPEGAATGGAPTLDELVTGTWAALTAAAAASCLICDGPLEPRYGAGHAPVGGRCTRCGSELS